MDKSGNNMAIVRKLDKLNLERDSKHTEVECTYSIIDSGNGSYLQVDTNGSKERQEQGKKSQSIRFSPEAIEQLKIIIEREL